MFGILVIYIYAIAKEVDFVYCSEHGAFGCAIRFFSYKNGIFTLHSVYFSVTLKRSKQKTINENESVEATV